MFIFTSYLITTQWVVAHSSSKFHGAHCEHNYVTRNFSLSILGQDSWFGASRPWCENLGYLAQQLICQLPPEIACSLIEWPANISNTRLLLDDAWPQLVFGRAGASPKDWKAVFMFILGSRCFSSFTVSEKSRKCGYSASLAESCKRSNESGRQEDVCLDQNQDKDIPWVTSKVFGLLM